VFLRRFLHRLSPEKGREGASNIQGLCSSCYFLRVFAGFGVVLLWGKKGPSKMPATAGRVRMPANNRVHSSAALQTHGIWQSAIGYDPYAPDQKHRGDDRGGPDPSAGGDAVATDEQNAYDSFQGLLALARLTGSNADEARGACKKCGRVGHLTFQCRNFLTAKEEAAAAAVAALERERGGTKGRDVGGGTGVVAGDATSSDEESEISDSDEDSEMERALARLGRSKKKSSKEKALDKEISEAKKKTRSSRRTKKKSKSRQTDLSPYDSDEGLEEDDDRKLQKRHSSEKRHRSSRSGRRDLSPDKSEESLERDDDRKHQKRHSEKMRHKSSRSSRRDLSSEESEGSLEKDDHKHHHKRHSEKRHRSSKLSRRSLSLDDSVDGSFGEEEEDRKHHRTSHSEKSHRSSKSSRRHKHTNTKKLNSKSKREYSDEAISADNKDDSTADHKHGRKRHRKE
jgi:hypothetical protein